MNIKIGRKLSLIDNILTTLKIERIDNVFQITAVTDVAVQIKSISNHLSYTISLNNFESSLKTFLTDEILAKRNKKVIQIKQEKPAEVIAPTQEVIAPTQEVNENIISPTFLKVAPTPLGKLVFRYLNNTPVVQINSIPNDPFSHLYD